MTSKSIYIVQCGRRNWTGGMILEDSVTLIHVHPDNIQNFIDERLHLLKEGKAIPSFSALLLTDDSYPIELQLFSDLLNVYEVFYYGDLWQKDSNTREFIEKYMGQKVLGKSTTEIVRLLSKATFKGQYGAKLKIQDLMIGKAFSHQSYYEGNRFLHIDNFYSPYYVSIASFRYNIYHEQDKLLSIWLEHSCSTGISLQLSIKFLPRGSRDEFNKEWLISGEDMTFPTDLSFDMSGYAVVSILAKGSGDIAIGSLHYRLSRGNFGAFLLGGERLCDHNGREIMVYFDPGDWKPPLNVYFSEYRTAEGFEGYFMMKAKGAPFLLIADPGLEGGAFYLGSDEIEEKIKRKIKEKLDFLGFQSNQLILSGLSMGTFGALYYGLDLSPYAIIVGKPLVNLGNIAKGTKWGRPGEFSTSLDLMLLLFGDLGMETLEKANRIFWDKLEKKRKSQTILAIAYMKDDDYDGTAFHDLLERGSDYYSRIIGKGWSGRHNDNSTAIGRWFTRQYDEFLKNDFQRGDK